MTYTSFWAWESNAMAKSSLAERNKAIREAWSKEQELVQEGIVWKDKAPYHRGGNKEE